MDELLVVFRTSKYKSASAPLHLYLRPLELHQGRGVGHPGGQAGIRSQVQEEVHDVRMARIGRTVQRGVAVSAFLVVNEGLHVWNRDLEVLWAPVS